MSPHLFLGYIRYIWVLLCSLWFYLNGNEHLRRLKGQCSSLYPIHRARYSFCAWMFLQVFVSLVALLMSNSCEKLVFLACRGVTGWYSWKWKNARFPQACEDGICMRSTATEWRLANSLPLHCESFSTIECPASLRVVFRFITIFWWKWSDTYNLQWPLHKSQLIIAFIFTLSKTKKITWRTAFLLYSIGLINQIVSTLNVVRDFTGWVMSSSQKLMESRWVSIKLARPCLCNLLKILKVIWHKH